MKRILCIQIDNIINRFAKILLSLTMLAINYIKVLTFNKVHLIKIKNLRLQRQKYTLANFKMKKFNIL